MEALSFLTLGNFLTFSPFAGRPGLRPGDFVGVLEAFVAGSFSLLVEEPSSMKSSGGSLLTINSASNSVDSAALAVKFLFLLAVEEKKRFG